jgi:hypothetical protein
MYEHTTLGARYIHQETRNTHTHTPHYIYMIAGDYRCKRTLGLKSRLIYHHSAAAVDIYIHTTHYWIVFTKCARLHINKKKTVMHLFV